MYNLISVLGWICFAAGLVYYFVNSGDAGRIQETVLQSQTIIITGSALVILGYVLRFISKKVGLGATSRCKKCGKKIDKAEMFCFDHRREAIWEAQEKHRLEGTGKFNRTQKRS
jgi:hypothetical protein